MGSRHATARFSLVRIEGNSKSARAEGGRMAGRYTAFYL